MTCSDTRLGTKSSVLSQPRCSKTSERQILLRAWRSSLLVMNSRTGREDNFLRILFHEPLDNPSQAGPLILRDAFLQTVDRPGGTGEPRPGRRLYVFFWTERSSTFERSELC